MPGAHAPVSRQRWNTMPQGCSSGVFAAVYQPPRAFMYSVQRSNQQR